MKQSITVVNGIGESTRGILSEHGIKTIADLAKASVAELAAVRGFGEARAANAIASAIALMGPNEGGTTDSPEPKPGKKIKNKKKAKDKKKDKKEKNKKKNKKDKKKKKKKK